MAWWRELMGLGIIGAFSISGAFFLGAAGLGLGFLVGLGIVATQFSEGR